MTRTLVLMRHAKSSWRDPATDDHERPLNARGRAAASALGDWLRAMELTPDQALVSSAERTRETFARLRLAVEPTYLDALYNAGEVQLQAALRGATGQTVLMIGHNPGLADFADDLIMTRPDHPQFFGFPTGSTLIARFDAEHWHDVTLGEGEVLNFVTPHDLPQT